MTGMNEKMEIKCLPSFKFPQASLLQSSESCQRIQALKWLWYPPFYTPHSTHIHTIYNFKKQNVRNSNKIPIFSFLLTDGPLCCYSDVVPDLPVGHPGLLLTLQCPAELFVSCSALEAPQGQVFCLKHLHAPSQGWAQAPKRWYSQSRKSEESLIKSYLQSWGQGLGWWLSILLCIKCPGES